MGRLGRLRTLPGLRPHAPAPQAEREVAHACIELVSLWSAFTRNYYLSTALGARGVGGVRVSTALQAAVVDDALTAAIHHLKPGLRKRSAPWSDFDEPTWRKTDVFLDVLTMAAASNLSTVQNALSATQTDVFTDLPTFRNFVAHKNHDTANRCRNLYRKYGVPRGARPVQALLLRQAGRPQALLLDWIDDIENVVTLTI